MAKSNKGWIKLHRKITDNWIWQEPEKLRAWLDILLSVNHEVHEVPVNGKIMKIEAGQMLTSMTKLAARWQWSRDRVRRFLNTLNESQMIHLIIHPFGVVITLTNWGLYQLGPSGSNTGNNTGSNTPNNTGGNTAVNTQTRSSKNEKEYKNAQARAIDQESKKGIKRNRDLDEWLRQQTIRRVTDDEI